MTDVADTGVRGQMGHCLPVVVLHLLHPAVVLFVALVGFLAELSPEVGSLPETGHGRFGKSLLQIRIVSYH